MEESEVKVVIRGILISNPKRMTVKELGIDFRKNEGMEIPFIRMGYNSLLDYLKSIPDTVRLDASSRHNPIVIPVTNEKTSHIDSLVMRQKIPSSSRKSSYCAPPPARRQQAIQSAATKYSSLMDNPVKKPAASHPKPSLLGEPPIKFKNLSYNYNQEGVYHKPQESSISSIPTEIINLINHLCFSAQGCSFTEIDRSLRHDLDKAGIKHIADVQSLLQDYFDVKYNRIYRKSTSYGSSYYQSSSNDKVSSAKSEKTATEVAAAAVAKTDNSSVDKKHVPIWAPASEVVCIPAGAESSMSYKSSDESGSYGFDSAMKNLSNNEGCKKVNLDDYDDDDDDGVESMVSSKVKRNLRLLINKYPKGIYCCDLEELYKKEFNYTLNYDEYGYNCLINMVSDLKSIFIMKRETRNSDYKLMSASLQKSGSFVEDTTKKWISREIVENICTVLERNAKGLPSYSLCDKYYDYHKKPLNPQSIGFDSVESLIDNIPDHIHQRKVKDTIFLYVKANPTGNNCVESQTPFDDKDVSVIYENDDDDPLPAREQLASLFSNIYPDEVCGPDDVYVNQSLADIVNYNSKYFEIRVSEVCTPHRFWIQLGRDYKKLDKMMLDLDEFYKMVEYNYVMPDMTLRPGQICACPYDSEERWHRTIILNTCGAVEVKIEYVDYGTVCRVHKSKLRFLHKDFLELPVQGVKARLSSILPPDGYDRWPRESCSKLLEMVLDRRLLMEPVSCDYEAGIIEGVLYDTNGLDDIIINDYLANNGYARFVPLNDDVDERDTDIENNFLDEPSHQLPNEESSLLSTTSVMDISRESNTLSTAVSNEPDIKSSSTQPVSTSRHDISGTTSFRPPPGFMPLNRSNTSGIGTQSNSLTGNISTFSASNAIPPLPPAQPPVKSGDLDMLVNILASKAVASASPNYFQNMYNSFQPPPYKSNQFNTYPEMNATSLNSFPSTSVNGSPLWYSMPCQTTNLPSSLGQINRPAPPMLFSQPPSSNVCVPFPYSVGPSQSTTLPFNQQYNNYHVPSPYLPPPQVPQTLPYQWPSYNVPPALPYSTSAPPPPGLRNTLPQSSQVSFDNAKNERPSNPPFHSKQTNTAVNNRIEDGVTENIVVNDLMKSPTKSSANIDNSSNNNASDDEKHNKLSSKQRKKLEKQEQSSGTSSFNNCSPNINVDSADRLCSDKVKTGPCDNRSSDNGGSKSQEFICSNSLLAESKNELPLVSATGTSKKKKKNKGSAKEKSESSASQVSTEALPDVTKSLPDVALHNTSINNNEESVVESWEELADDVKSNKKGKSSNKSNKTDDKDNKIKTINTTSISSNNSNNKVDSKSNKQKEKQAQSNQDKVASTKHSKKSTSKNYQKTDNNDQSSVESKCTNIGNEVLETSDTLPNSSMTINDSNEVTSVTSDIVEPVISGECKNNNSEENEVPRVKDSVIKKVICDKTIHLISESLDDKKIVVATDELVTVFTPFSKRNSFLKFLDYKRIENPFYDICEQNFQELFKELESFTIEAVLKKGEPMPNKLNVLPLVSVPVILKALNVDQSVIDGFHLVVDEMKLV